MENLYLTKYEEVVKEIDRIWYEFAVDAGAMFGRLSEMEVRKHYSELLNNLDRIPGLTDEERKMAMEKINEKIEKVPEQEKNNVKEYNEGREKHNSAFEEAKQRYKEQSLWKKIGHHINKTTPKSYNPDYMHIDKIDGLYR